MSVKYCPPCSLLLLAKTITHPAQRSLCDSWASCKYSGWPLPTLQWCLVTEDRTSQANCWLNGCCWNCLRRAHPIVSFSSALYKSKSDTSLEALRCNRQGWHIFISENAWWQLFRFRYFLSNRIFTRKTVVLNALRCFKICSHLKFWHLKQLSAQSAAAKPVNECREC